MSNNFTELDEGRVRTTTTPTTPATDQAPLGDLVDKVSEDLSAARSTIEKGAEAGLGKIKNVVADQANFAAHQASGIATALERVGAELEETDQRAVGRYAKQIGASVQRLATQIEGKDIGEVATMAEDFGRKQPLAFLGIAAIAGLAASRFLTASAERSKKTSGVTRSNSNLRGGRDV